MKGLRLLASAAIAATMIAGTAPAMAGTNADLLKRLHEKGILTDDEYQQLMASEKAESAAAKAPPMAQAQAALDDKRLVRAMDSGVGIQVGDVALKFSGQVNGFYVYDSPSKGNQPVVGGVVGGTGDSSSVRNGLLPGYLKIEAMTNLGGWDVGAHFGMYPGINSTAYGALGANNGGQPTALATAGIDFRQTYLTIGKPSIGELKIGRDIGLFGSEGILNDITLLSSGSTGGNVAPGNTTLGRIGIGYIYTDFQPQITYTSPSFGGLQASVGVFQPLTSLSAPGPETNGSPGFQAKVTYDNKIGGVATRLWVSGITQKHDAGAGLDYTGSGFDVGARVGVGPVTLTGYYYNASGLGTTVLNLFDNDGAGNKRDSEGFYLQGMTTFGKISLGGSYGESTLDHANLGDAIANPTLVRRNSSWVGQVRYGFNSWVTLIAEYVSTTSRAHNGNRAESDAVAAGAILFF